MSSSFSVVAAAGAGLVAFDGAARNRAAASTAGASGFGGIGASVRVCAGCCGGEGWVTIFCSAGRAGREAADDRAGSTSGSSAYLARRSRTAATSLPPSSLCPFIWFCQAAITGSVRLRQRATSSAPITVIECPRTRAASTTALASKSHMAPAMPAAVCPA